MEELQNMMLTKDSMELVYWGLAIAATVVFCIQAVMLFIGFDTDADFSGGDADFDADGLHLVSFKTVVCFILGFGWTGAFTYNMLENKAVVAVIALAAGVCFMMLIAFLLGQVLKLSKDNTFTTSKVVGITAEVYLRIPGGDEPGKITVSHEGSTHELMAFADATIATGARVTITHVVSDDSVFVAPIELV